MEICQGIFGIFAISLDNPKDGGWHMPRVESGILSIFVSVDV